MRRRRKRPPPRLARDGRRIERILRERLGDDWMRQHEPWRVTETHRTVLVSADMAFALDDLTGEPICRRRNCPDDGWVTPGEIRWGVRPITGQLSMN
jgi:hypothetical protein